ncbi:MAG: hypothetical protein ABI563_04545 [Specibacter sp.]
MDGQDVFVLRCGSVKVGRRGDRDGTRGPVVGLEQQQALPVRKLQDVLPAADLPGGDPHAAHARLVVSGGAGEAHAELVLHQAVRPVAANQATGGDCVVAVSGVSAHRHEFAVVVESSQGVPTADINAQGAGTGFQEFLQAPLRYGKAFSGWIRSGFSLRVSVPNE